MLLFSNEFNFSKYEAGKNLNIFHILYTTKFTLQNSFRNSENISL